MSGPLNEDTDMPPEEDAPAEERWGRSRHSRFVSTMKVVLPLGAIALMATVLFYSGIFDGRDRLDVTFREISSLNNDLRMVSPRVTGLDKSGRPYLLTADTATQAKGQPSHITLDNVQADLKLSDEADWVSLSSASGLLDTETQVLELRQKIDIYGSSGYEFHGTSGRIDFREGTVSSDEPVQGHGPLGTLRADRMTADNGERKLRFTGHVKVRIYGKQ
ncbi:MAG: LPS export ABC transporter periplasmic protein LptC [Parvibaculum sp.]|uniref:LPS export ABC transporter periplasmic protein LptC n=1 Tax=Parvibaculum sp. TaxID=2024848 RepID=UPI0025D34992|nr:LPS export ABC transporter periplasmic protein LptC [Parvibaculum sp.]MCE9650123.1 LPS export ABC transporter periplasmic protein LptC [Parvibaculum sp.]